MVLEKNIKNEKIRKTKRRLKRLDAKYNDLMERLRYLRPKLENCERLVHRSECPVCKQKIDYKYYENQIPELKYKIELIYAWISQNYNCFKAFRIRKPITELEEANRKERRAKIESYLKEHRNQLNRAIRTFELPDITNIEEKELWNDAIELQLDKKGMAENEELQFEIFSL